MIVDVVLILCATLLLKLRPEVPVTVWLAIVAPVAGARAASMRAAKKERDSAPPAPPGGGGPGSKDPPSLLRKLFEGSGAVAIFVGLGAAAWGLFHHREA